METETDEQALRWLIMKRLRPNKIVWWSCKGQASAFYYGDPLGEMRLVSRVFEM